MVSQAATVCSTRLQGEPQGFHMIHAGERSVEIERHVFGGESFGPNATFTFTRNESGWTGADRATRHEIDRIA